MSRFEHHGIADDTECDCGICPCDSTDECEDLNCKCCSLECQGVRIVVNDDLAIR